MKVTHILDEEVMLAHKKASAKQIQELAEQSLRREPTQDPVSSVSGTEKSASNCRQGSSNLLRPNQGTSFNFHERRDQQPEREITKSLGVLDLDKTGDGKLEGRMTEASELLLQSDTPAKDEIRKQMQSLIRRRRKNRQMAIYKSMNLSSELRMSLTGQSSVFKKPSEPTRFNQTFSGFSRPSDKKSNTNGLIVKRMRQKKQKQQKQQQRRSTGIERHAMFLTRRDPKRSSLYLLQKSQNRIEDLRLSQGKMTQEGRQVSEFRYDNDKPSSISNKIQNFISMKNIEETSENSRDAEDQISFRRTSTHQETCKKPLNRESSQAKTNNRISIKIHNQNKIELNGNNFQIFNKPGEPRPHGDEPPMQRRHTTMASRDNHFATTGSLEENDFSKDQVKVDPSQFRRRQQVYTSLGMIKRRRKKLSMRPE